jgi:hypothetical protein
MELILLALAVGAVIYFLRRMARLEQQANDRVAEMIQHMAQFVHLVEVEEINGVEYWYDAQDRTFLGQGATRELVISVLRERFPKHSFILPSMEVIQAPDWEPKSIESA